jgi:hypothetical protein
MSDWHAMSLKIFAMDPTVGSVCNRVWDTIDGIQWQVSEIPVNA